MRYALLPIGLTVAFLLLVGSGNLGKVPVQLWQIAGLAALVPIGILLRSLTPRITRDRNDPTRLYAVYDRLWVEDLTPKRRRKRRATAANRSTTKRTSRR